MSSPKHLMLLRHAKSSWDDASLSDFDRPLNARGRLAAPFMGELMARNDLVPELIISSPANRAAETARLVKESSGFNVDIHYDERIYEASRQTLFNIVSAIDDNIGAVLMVGHNPGFEGILNLLTGEEQSMPTASMASVKIDGSWADILPGASTLVKLYRPKEEMRSEL